MIENAAGTRRKWFLYISIIANVGVLAIFKYYNFFAININTVLSATEAHSSIPLLAIILPIGLSFHTFQAMSYTIEVYRGNQKAERHLGIYALYVMFYPQLVAGPIERPQNMLHQFHKKHVPEYDRIVSGLRLMLWGLVKKVIIADRLATVVDSFFNHPEENSGIGLAIGSIFFAFQIFCDFSGYSDIAIGAARVMGIKFMVNFNMPYHSKSISEFWKRWHISLSTWFRDYLYITLGGNRVSKGRMYFNLFFVFMVSGFWHGASWTFIIWGMIHGFYLIFAIVTEKARNRFNNAIGISKVPWLNNTVSIFTTFFLVTAAWIFFRANNLTDAFFIFNKLSYIPQEIATIIRTHKIAFLNLPGIYNVLLPCFLLIAFLELAHVIQIRFNLENTFSSRPAYVRWALYTIATFSLIYYGVYDEYQFIYFQF